MKITNKCEFTLGIINILIAITGTIILIAQHDTERIYLLSICLGTGISGILCGIETDKQRQKRIKKLKLNNKEWFDKEEK